MNVHCVPFEKSLNSRCETVDWEKTEKSIHIYVKYLNIGITIFLYYEVPIGHFYEKVRNFKKEPKLLKWKNVSELKIAKIFWKVLLCLQVQRLMQNYKV